MIIMALPIYHFALRDYQRQRITSFINPNADPLGQGTQSQLRFLPEHHTDFIFASLSEELGFVGSMVVVLLFLLLLRRIYEISQSVSDPAASAFCLGIMALLTFQIFVNIGMNLGIA